MTKTILALTVLTSICFAGAAFAGEATNVGLTCYWVCKERKTDYYGPHCVNRVQECKISQQPLRPLLPPAKTLPH